MATAFRTHTCGELRATDAGARVTLAGWVHRRRDHGHLAFFDLRDRHGITQVVTNADEAPEAHAAAELVRNEWVVHVSGIVRERPEGTANAELATGEIEECAEAVQLRTMQLAFSDEGDKIVLAVERQADARLIGEVSLIWRSIPDLQGEVGYIFHPDAHGQGYASEAARALLAFGFEVEAR